MTSEGVVSGENKTCPECRAPMEVMRFFSTWCDACKWNLVPSDLTRAVPSRRERLFASVGARAADRLERQFSQPDALRPPYSVSKLAAFAIAGLVHLLTVVLVIGGILLLLTGNVAAIIAGLAAIGAAWALRPRAAPTPPDLLDDAAAPELRSLAAEIANAVGTRGPDAIRVTDDFNASVSEAGWGRRRILDVGLPLFAVLEPQERVAVLAHEFGHYANGDVLRGWFVGSAVEALINWWAFLVPRSLFDSEDQGVPGLLMFPANVLMLTMSSIPLGAAYALVALLFRDSQRAEYLADAHAARVAGSDALIAGWQKLHLSGAVEGISHATTDEHWANRSLWDELRLRAGQFPDRERERARRVDQLMASRLDLTHPPTASRIRVVGLRDRSAGSLSVDEDQAARLDAELRAETPRVQRELIETYRSSLNY